MDGALTGSAIDSDPEEFAVDDVWLLAHAFKKDKSTAKIAPNIENLQADKVTYLFLIDGHLACYPAFSQTKEYYGVKSPLQISLIDLGTRKQRLVNIED